MADDRQHARGARRRELGRGGEDLAARYLEGQGIVVLSRNWRCREGELDLVATDGAQLIVCEVKTRSGLGYGTPAESVTQEKIARIRRLTNQWLAEFRVGWVPTRYDVLAIVWPAAGNPAVSHIEGAF